MFEVRSKNIIRSNYNSIIFLKLVFCKFTFKNINDKITYHGKH
jgi:hypothetical protein